MSADQATVRELILAARRELAAHQVDDVSFNADCLAAKILHVSNGRLPHFWEQPASEGFTDRYHQLVLRRCQHEPLQYIVGEWGFLDFDVTVGPEALIPRPETEEVFLAACDAIGLRSFKECFQFADVGTGTGILGIAMTRRFTGAHGTLLDLSEKALALAKKNLNRFPEIASRVTLLCSDLLSSFEPASLQVVIANPPYIVSDDIANLQTEVRQYEPMMALDGGSSGIELIEKLVSQAENVLVAGGLLVFEHGHGQRQQLMALLNGNWRLVRAGDDLCGRERFFVLERL